MYRCLTTLIGRKFQLTHRTARPRTEGSWLPCSSKDNKGIIKILLESPTLTLTTVRAIWSGCLSLSTEKANVNAAYKAGVVKSGGRSGKACFTSLHPSEKVGPPLTWGPEDLLSILLRAFQECGNGFRRCYCLILPAYSFSFLFFLSFLFFSFLFILFFLDPTRLAGNISSLAYR